MLRFKKNEKNIDLFLIFTLFFPVFGEQLASILLSVISSVISSNIDVSYLNATALVGSVVGPLTTLYASIASGASILMSQYMGADDKELSRKLFSSSNLIGFIVSIFISVIIILFRNPALTIMYPKMSESFLKNASVYAVFLAISIPLSFFKTNVIGILRSCLDTKGPLYISLLGGFSNIVLKFLFMVIFDLGIWGLGMATLISEILFTFVCAFMLKKVEIFNGCIKDIFKLSDKTVSINTIKIGSVMCLQSFATSVSGLFLSRIIALMGDVQMSVHTIVMSSLSLFVAPLNSMAYVAQILAGKHTGAGDYKKALEVSLKITYITMIMNFALAIIAYPISEFIVGMYTDDKTIVDFASRAFRVWLLFSPVQWSMANVFSAGIRGSGNVKYPAWVLVFTAFLFQLPMTYLVCKTLAYGASGRIFVYALEQLVYALFFTAYGIIKFRSVRNDTNRV